MPIKNDTVQKLIDALRAIEDQFTAIEYGKSEKRVWQHCETITEAADALEKDLEAELTKTPAPPEISHLPSSR